MNSISEAHFLRWAKRRGVAVDPRYPYSAVLTFAAGIADSRFWVVPPARPECGALVTLLFSTTIFGWSVQEDTYVVPDNGRYLLQTDHHNVVHVVFRDATDVAPFVQRMEVRGFSLPDEPPDSTFKHPDWMPEKAQWG
jgi:hypothetical protein